MSEQKPKYRLEIADAGGKLVDAGEIRGIGKAWDAVLVDHKHADLGIWLFRIKVHEFCDMKTPDGAVVGRLTKIVEDTYSPHGDDTVTYLADGEPVGDFTRRPLTDKERDAQQNKGIIR